MKKIAICIITLLISYNSFAFSQNQNTNKIGNNNDCEQCKQQIKNNPNLNEFVCEAICDSKGPRTMKNPKKM